MEARESQAPNVAPERISLNSLLPLSKLWRELKAHSRLVWIAQATCLIAVGANALVPFGLKWGIGRLQAGDASILVWVPLVGLALVAFVGLVQMARGLLTQYITLLVAKNLQKRIFSCYLRQGIREQAAQPVGEKVSRMTFDIHWLVEGAAIFLSDTIYVPLMITGCLAIMFYLEWRIALVCLLVAPLALFAGKPVGLRLTRSTKKLQTINADFTGHVVDSLRGLLLVKIYGRETKTGKVMEEHLDTFIRGSIVNSFWGGTFQFAVTLGNAVAVCLVAWVAFYLVREAPSFKLADLVAFTSVMFFLFGEIMKVGGAMNTLAKASASVERIYQLLEKEPAPRATKGVKATFNQGIVCQGVSFGYEDKLVLKDVNLGIKPGEKIALLGLSGVGKTTLVRLLVGLLEPRAGKILYDGVDGRELDPDSLRGLFGYSPQMSIIFCMSVADNIAFSRPEASREAVVEAAKLAQAHEFISAMPQGYDTIVGEEGAFVSEGQRQRIAMARAFLRDAPIIVLDESTSHVDMLTEKAIYNNVTSLPDKTLLIISHRPSVLRQADRIFSIADQKLIDLGSFSELASRRGHDELLEAMEFIH